MSFCQSLNAGNSSCGGSHTSHATKKQLMKADNVPRTTEKLTQCQSIDGSKHTCQLHDKSAVTISWTPQCFVSWSLFPRVEAGINKTWGNLASGEKTAERLHPCDWRTGGTCYSCRCIPLPATCGTGTAIDPSNARCRFNNRAATTTASHTSAIAFPLLLFFSLLGFTDCRVLR